MLILNDQLIAVEAAAGLSLVDFIRGRRQLKGTKTACREGDCGACSVLTGEWREEQMHYRLITSCISPLGNALGRHVVTIEGLNLPDGRLNAIQQALKEEGATQCGFCTPGFVLALTGMALEKIQTGVLPPVLEALSGNICRCTGYKSIERAAEKLRRQLEKAHSLQDLVALNFLPEYFLRIPEQMRKLPRKPLPQSDPLVLGGGSDLFVQQAPQIADKNPRLLVQDETLRGIERKNGRVHIGAATPVEDIIRAFPHAPLYLKDQLQLVASLPIRNMATPAGNFVNASPIGDLSILFLALDATLHLQKPDGSRRELPLRNFFTDYKKYDLQEGEIITQLSFEEPPEEALFSFEKVSKRTYLDIASVNSAMLLETDTQTGLITKAALSLGGVSPIPLYAAKTSAFLYGKALDEESFRQAAKILQSEIKPISDVRGSETYKRQLATQLLFAHLAKALKKETEEENAQKNNRSSAPAPPLSAGAAIPNIDSDKHLRGESLYVDDLPLLHGSLHGLVFDAPVAHAEILELSVKEAEAVPGVLRILTAADIPGENQIGNIIPDEPLFAEKEIHYCGQPLALILAETPEAARLAREHIHLRYRELPPVTTEEEAYEKGLFITPPRTFLLGRPDEAFAKCKYVFEGKTYTNGQEHLYLETQSAYAFPAEGDNIKIISSTQGPSQVQKAAAKVLGLPMHKIELEVTRLGGGFGGKEDQATPWGVMAALGAKVCKRPVKLVLDRHQDLRATGKRHPYTSYFKIGLDEELKIRAYEVKFLQNAGAAADLSPAVAERTLFHATNSYFIENVRATVYSCKTNLPPNTAFRGFGGPQGMFVIEAAIARAASELGVPARHIQELNLLKEGDLFPYGQKAEQALARQSWQTAQEEFGLAEICRKAEEFNKKSTYIKKGVALMPVCFGISFTNTSMNQARALVHVYADGSVGVSTGAVEMGQGVNTKLLQIAAQTFSIDHRRVKIETTNTTRVANTSPSAASATTDLNGKALLKACTEIKNRLLHVAAKQLKAEPENISLENERVLLNGQDSGLSWVKLIQTALLQRISLSETAHYATPRIQFDKRTEKGQPFSYHVYGTAIITATVDCLRGRYEIESVQIAHDFGKSINLYIDRGQVEGGLVQGLGWMCMEEVVYDERGRLRSNALSTYKVPDIFAAPRRIDITPVSGAEAEAAIFKSKAVGEPPLMYGIGAYFAILNAIRAYRPDAPMRFDAPFTPEKVMALTAIKQPIHEEQA